MTDVPRLQRRWVTCSDELASTARTRGRYAVVAVPQRPDQGRTLRLPGTMCATLAAQAYGQRSDVGRPRPHQRSLQACRPNSRSRLTYR